jgi:hypothetical protein
MCLNSAKPSASSTSVLAGRSLVYVRGVGYQNRSEADIPERLD